MDQKRHKVDILGVQVDDISEKNAVRAILQMAGKAKGENHPKHVVTINAEFVMLARKNKNFSDVLGRADLAVPDGKGVVLAKLILGGSEHDRVTGVDLVEKLCKQGAKRAVRVGFLGGFDGVAEIVSKRQKEQNPDLKVVFAGPGDPTIGYDSRLKKELFDRGRVDIMFVAYGMGQQEFWIERNRHGLSLNKNSLDVGVFVGVGGAFDYLSMVKTRAPIQLQNIGLEWFWRLLAEPGRIWRMRVLPVFAIMVIGQFLGQKLNLSTKKIF